MLNGCRILVAEDEFFLAADIVRVLGDAGATIVGPIGTLHALQRQVAADGFDVALLDIRLANDMVYPAADLIREAGIPLAFLSGYDRAALPARFAAVALYQKPFGDELVRRIGRDLCRAATT